MQQSGETENQLRLRALPYFKELVALPHNFWQDVSAVCYRWIISLGYKKKVEVDAKKLARYRNMYYSKMIFRPLISWAVLTWLLRVLVF